MTQKDLLEHIRNDTIDVVGIDAQNDTTSIVSEQTINKEVGGRIGLDPSRYGDWEKNGRCIDF